MSQIFVDRVAQNEELTASDYKNLRAEQTITLTSRVVKLMNKL